MEIADNNSGRVLLVDDEPSVCMVMNDALLQEGYNCRSCTSGEDALKLLHGEWFDVVITDLYMPGISGMSLLRQGQRARPESVFLVVTGERDARVGVEAMKQGAADYLVKPFQIPSLISSVRRARQKQTRDYNLRMRHELYKNRAAKRTTQLKSALARIGHSRDATIEALGTLLDIRDSETAGHSHRVCLYTLELAKRMNVPRRLWRDFLQGAFLHDVGKIGIPDEILLKPDRLTTAEMTVMKTHATVGYHLIKRLDHLSVAAEMVRSHHERYDGTGYPCGLKGEEIPLGSRIFAVADTLDAMTTDRPYRRALPMEDAYREIEAGAGAQFDPKVVEVFGSASLRVWEGIRENVSAIQGAMRTDWWNSDVILQMSRSIGMILDPEPEKAPPLSWTRRSRSGSRAAAHWRRVDLPQRVESR